MIVKVDDAGIMPGEELEKVKQVPFPSCIFSLLAFLVLLLDWLEFNVWTAIMFCQFQGWIIFINDLWQIKLMI